MSAADIHFGNFCEDNQRFINLAAEACNSAIAVLIYFRNLFAPLYTTISKYLVSKPCLAF